MVIWPAGALGSQGLVHRPGWQLVSCHDAQGLCLLLAELATNDAQSAHPW